LCILFWDIDHFKQVNDVYGHLFGDKVLESMGAVAKACFRAQDMTCRYGGEEFVACLPGTDSETGTIAARRLMRQIAELSFKDYPDFSYTVSVGMFCAVPKEEDTLIRGISLADQALYAAKNNGRNKLVEFGSREYTTPEACLLPSPV
jgi:diguanylate cyclase (GGDEF)-like protein